MKKIFTVVLACLSLTAVNAQSGGLLKRASGILNKGSGSLSNEDIIAGLKEALTVGAQKSASQLSSVDGFFANAAIKVLLPDEAKKVESTLRSAGMGHLVDNAILSMNRAAEEASKSAAPIFVNAVKGMNVQDGLSILKGNDSAATSYLKGKTLPELTNAFRPVIESALEKTDATKHWKNLFETYNKLPTTFKKINTDLSGYVTERALSGLFFQVAAEEKKIRKDPAARVSEVLKKVFG